MTVYNLTCSCCGKEFTHKNRRRKYCSEECEKITYRNRAKKAMRKKRKKSPDILSLTQFENMRENYNIKHKTHYTYGQFVSKVNLGIIKTDEC